MFAINLPHLKAIALLFFILGFTANLDYFYYQPGLNLSKSEFSTWLNLGAEPMYT